jgi:hypothetical protein
MILQAFLSAVLIEQGTSVNNEKGNSRLGLHTIDSDEYDKTF